MLAGLRGWRTFRVRLEADPLIAGGECVCPASDEAGHRTTCEQCQLCRGTSRPARGVAIVAHGKPSTLRAYGIDIGDRIFQPTNFYRSRAEVPA